MSRHCKHYRSTYTRFNKRNDENRGRNIMFCWRNVKKPCRLYTHSSSMVTLDVNTVVLTENRLLRTFNRVSTPTAKPNQVFITPFARYTLLFSGIPWNFLYGVTRTHVRILYTYVYFCYRFYADILHAKRIHHVFQVIITPLSRFVRFIIIIIIDPR